MKRITIRLREDEYKVLKHMALNNENLGFENISEYIRMLIHREHNRRHSTSPVRGIVYSTASRNGRPPQPKVSDAFNEALPQKGE